MATAAPGRRRAGPVRALVALLLLWPAVRAHAGADGFAAEVAAFAHDLAVGDGAAEVGGMQVDFALRVIAPFGARAEAGGLRLGMLRGPYQPFVPYSALRGGTVAPTTETPFDASGRAALGRARELYAAAERSLAAELGPVRAGDLLRTSSGHFGLRPFGVQEGPSVRSRARASSLRWLRGLAADAEDADAQEAALRLWRRAAELRPEGSFFVTGQAVLDAFAELSSPGPHAGAAEPRGARDGRRFALLARLGTQDRSLEPLDPYAADRLVEALAWLASGHRALRARPSPAPAGSPRPTMFSEATRGSGLELNPADDRVSVGGALLDYDGDGRLDLYACVGSLGGRLFRGSGDLRFEDATGAAGLSGSYCRAAAADYDGDGDPDLALSDSMGALRLMRNDGGRFTDVSREAGLPPDPMPTQSLVWFDSDGDGRLDLYAVNHGGIVEGNAPYAGDALNGVRNRLLRQTVPGRFGDVPGGAGADDRRWGRGAVAADLDGDGRADLAVANDFGTPRILLAAATAFVDATEASGVGGLTHSLGVSAADFDGDGRQDLLFSSFDRRRAPAPSLSDPSPRTLVDAESFWMGEDVSSMMRPQLYRGLGAGRFSEEWERLVPAVYTGAAWNGTFVDLDSDGRQDIVFATGFHPDGLFFHSDRTIVFLQEADGGRFRDASKDSGLDFPDSSRAALFGDLDGDGDLDAVVLGYSGPRVFRNDAPRRTWAAVSLRGRDGRTSYGAKVVLSCGGREQTFLYGTFGGGFVSSFSGGIYAGFGECKGPVSASVRWPSGTQESFAVPAGRTTLLSEGKGR